MPSEEHSPKFLRKDKVCEITGLPVSSVYRLMSDGDFPRPVKLSANRVAWIEAEVQAWIKERIDAAKPKRVQRQQKRR